MAIVFVLLALVGWGVDDIFIVKTSRESSPLPTKKSPGL